VPRIQVAKAFRRHVECPDLTLDGGSTVRESLDRYFETYPAVRSYVLDERGALRKHVVIFIGDEQIVDRSQLSDAVGDRDVVYIFQALSGG
jgi:molybdopterin converting factor small subunit